MAQDLPKQYDHLAAQQRWYAYWEEHGCFESHPDPEHDSFCIVIPPPNVTGALHLGHALNNTLQDSLIRLKRMQGYEALWMPGTDHAGIATQAVVERRLKEQENKTRHDLGREALVQRIWAWKDDYEKRIIGQLKQMGCSCDWSRTRFTLDQQCARAVRHTFFRLFRDGLIYRGLKLVNWDTHLQTAVSDDEVFSETIRGKFWHFRYPVIDPQPGEPDYVEVATTRPETMLGDTAVAVHPNPAGQLEKVEAELKEKLAKASEKEKPQLQKQIDALQARRTKMLPLLETLRDMAAAGRQVRLPLMDRPIPLVADTWAKPELGSGCVKITPAHDPNDYQVGQRQDLPMINILHKDGTLNHQAGPYAGLTMKKARQQVAADLDEQGLLGDVEDRDIELPHSDRSKTPIEPLLADQWFVNMETLAKTAMDAVEDGRVKIIPGRYAKSYLDWLSEKRDWPVSRQLWWGHQIPVWSLDCPDEESLEQQRGALQQLLASQDDWQEVASWQEDLNEERAAAKRRGGREWELAKEKLPHATLHVCLLEDDPAYQKPLEELGFVRSEDVLDTWFSSALWPHSTLGWPESTLELDYYYPTSVLITSRDIITLWVARMVLTGLYNVGDVPFGEVFIHPKILDGDGETMSKSKGNGVDPLDVIQNSGADALRFGLAYLTTETQDVRMPVSYECPHCGHQHPQTKDNRKSTRVQCPQCQQDFGTQWSESPEDLALKRGLLTSERFDIGRTFCNKLWNASRFTLMNLEGMTPGSVAESELTLEDRWLLSRLETVAGQVASAIQEYRYGDAARTMYGFAWNEFCSFFVEMVKYRLQDESLKPVAQRVLAHCLDQLLRILHPLLPFLTEEVWHLLGEAAPERGIEDVRRQAESIMRSSWPATIGRRDARIEARFHCFEGILRGVRDVRTRQTVPPGEEVQFSIRCQTEAAELLEPLVPYFHSMSRSQLTEAGPEVKQPPAAGSFTFTAEASELGTLTYEVFVDLRAFIDYEKEIAQKEKKRDELNKAIASKRGQLSNENFVKNAPPEVVQARRESLAEAEAELAALNAQLEELRAQIP